MALLGSASVSSAADCVSDPNECTLKKLCEASTTLDGNNTIWATFSKSDEMGSVLLSKDAAKSPCPLQASLL